MSEENQHDESEPRDPSLTGGDDGYSSSTEPPAPASASPFSPSARVEHGDEEYTRPLPPYTQTAVAPAPARRTGVLTAAVLAGALLVGGAAGVGGAAWYDAWSGDPASSARASSSAANNNVTPTSDNSSSAPAGDVEKVAAAVLPSVVKINVAGASEQGSGSGIVLSKDGNILTNNHVVQVAADGGTISVNFNDGTTKRATVVGTDPVTDIAVIKAEGVDNLVPAQIGKSDAIKVGQGVVAVGSPYGLNATVTSGIVSALNRPVSVSAAGGASPFGGGQQSQGADLSTTYPAIQTDAAINPGNSGGPLVDLAGRVVGINSSIRTGGSGGQSSGAGGSVGLGFAIPIDEVLPIVNQLLDKQTPTHARLGVTVSDVSGDTLQQGAQIKTVESGSAGDQAGLKSGDVITKVSDEVIDGSESLVATIRGHRPDEKVTLTYVRGGDTATLTATLGSDARSKSS